MGNGIGEMVGNALGLSEQNPSDVEAIISRWPDRPRLGAQSMIAKYGAPQESTSEELTWLGQGPYKKIIVTKDEHRNAESRRERDPALRRPGCRAARNDLTTSCN